MQIGGQQNNFPEPPPIEIKGFEILGKIGSGGMATVWKARQASLDRIVAVKVLRSDFCSDPEEVQLFVNEARSAANLTHPHIVQVYDAGQVEGMPYFVMEYVPGRSLGNLLRDQGPMPLKKALKTTALVAEALDYAWRRVGMVHRDIKPDNIMIGDDGSIKVADLGLARPAGAFYRQAASAFIEGTPNYMAPEQVKGLTPDCRADIYALGATFYHMVTGNLPFAEGDGGKAMVGHLEGAIPNPRDLNPRLPLGIVQLLTRMMMKKPEERYADWSEVLRDLKRVTAGRMLLQPVNREGSTIATAIKGDAESRPVERPAAPKDSIPAWWYKLRLLALVLFWAALAFKIMYPFVDHLRKMPDEHVPPASLMPEDESVGKVQIEPEFRDPEYPPDPTGVTVDPRAAAESYRVLLHEITTRLFASGYLDAILTIQEAQNHGGYTRRQEMELQDLARMISEAAAVNRLIWENIRQQVGSRITLRRDNRDVELLIGSVAESATEYILELRDVNHASQAELVRVDSLDPHDRLRLLGPADNAAKALMHVLLLQETGDSAAAIAMASRCGPLEDVLIRHLQER